MTFQDAASPIMEQILSLHDFIFFYLTLITVIVIYVLASIINSYVSTKQILSVKSFIHGTRLEIIWTIIPILILISIAFPSLKLLYMTDEVIDPVVTIKTIGHQWYWSYEYGDYKDTISYDSYMVAEQDLQLGQFRLLEVDNRVVLPIKSQIRVIVTAADVLHSWAVPSLGVKVDAIPGRLNQTNFNMKREGVFYGQCSELCGFGHGYMPIVVEGVSKANYVSWLKTQLANN